jgi:UPF0755 protein
MARKIIIVVFVSVVAVLAVTNMDRIKAWIKGPSAQTTNTTEVRILFDSDPTFNELIDLLVEKEVVKDGKELREIAASEKMDTTSFAGGKYVVLTQTRLKNLLEGFRKGEDGNGNAEVMVNVIFNNCRDVHDIAGNISKCIVADSTELANFILNPETLKRYGFTYEQMPALFLPKRYEMPYDTDAEGFVSFMAARFKEFWTPERKAKMRSLGFTSQSQVVTLASIVYSEQGKLKDEWPIIAGLYLNRLKKGMRLQSDPTFKFCWGHELDNVQRLTYEHRDIDCAYNTYKIDGLPPGPICITPASVVEAVLEPADVDYIFMCAKPDYSGGHNFTSSGSVHSRNASVYQKWLAKELKKNR